MVSAMEISATTHKLFTKSKVVLSVGDKGVRKGVKYFTKNLLKAAKGSTENFEKSLFSLGREINNPKSRGRERKTGKLIPIQVTAKSRRAYKHRGRTVGLLGRRPKDQNKRSQLVVTEAGDNVYHSLPKQKKLRKKKVHCFQASVDLNKPAAKKH